jgi:hypothetical protein
MKKLCSNEINYNLVVNSYIEKLAQKGISTQVLNKVINDNINMVTPSHIIINNKNNVNQESTIEFSTERILSPSLITNINFCLNDLQQEYGLYFNFKELILSDKTLIEADIKDHYNSVMNNEDHFKYTSECIFEDDTDKRVVTMYINSKGIRINCYHETCKNGNKYVAIQSEITSLFICTRILDSNYPFIDSPQQTITEVLKSILHSDTATHYFIKSPTGVGKTYSSLQEALIIAESKNKSVIIAFPTKNLLNESQRVLLDMINDKNITNVQVLTFSQDNSLTNDELRACFNTERRILLTLHTYLLPNCEFKRYTRLVGLIYLFSSKITVIIDEGHLFLESLKTEIPIIHQTSMDKNYRAVNYSNSALMKGKSRDFKITKPIVIFEKDKFQHYKFASPRVDVQSDDLSLEKVLNKKTYDSLIRSSDYNDEESVLIKPYNSCLYCYWAYSTKTKKN